MLPPPSTPTQRWLPSLLSHLLALALTSCGGNLGQATTDAVPSSAVDTGGDVASGPPPSGQIVLDACIGHSGVAQRCTLVTNASACTNTRCEKLVVVFSGGEMGCATGAGHQEVLAGYAQRGYAAVCINYFDNSKGSGGVPFLNEASRIDVAVREATTGAWAKAYWTGRDLLLQGISHGATAPVILMARTALDDQPHWRGNHFTAGCFFDGSYDQAATAALLKNGGFGGWSCKVPVPYTRWLERYCGAGATAATCDLASHTKAKLDTITAVPSEAYAIRDFKLFECGSALAACTGDIIPAPPIQQLCSAIDTGPQHTCSFVSLASDSHLTCHRNAYDQCRQWFESLLPP